MALRAITGKQNLWRNNATRFLKVGNVRGLKKASLPDLPYGYGALEPIISREIMELHHKGHHNTYVTNYNNALEKLHAATEAGDHPTIVQLQSAIKFNGGGHLNHSIYWSCLAPQECKGGDPPEGEFAAALEGEFGGLEKLINKMKMEGSSLQGSGWVWLGLDKDTRKLQVDTTQNQDPLVTRVPELVPLLGVDLWEHSYYLQYKNEKAEYLKHIWKVVNWKYAQEIYEKVCAA